VSIILLGYHMSIESWAMKHMIQTLNFPKANRNPNQTVRVPVLGL